MLERMRLRGAGVPGAWHQVAIQLKSTGELAGDCAFCVLEEDPPVQAEIGFTLAPAHQRRGYATEAVTELLRYLFDTLALHRVRANCDAENLASARLMERLGMRCEGHFVENARFKGRWTSELHFAILAREWRDRQQGAGNLDPTG
jgi:aminoglycoside 6'-N-acetyltransferase